MSKLSQNQIKAFDEAEKAINKESKALQIIYKNSLRNIRAEIQKLNEKIDWSFSELNKFDRLKKLEKQIANELRKISNSSLKLLSKTNSGITNNTYNRSWFGYTKEVEADINFGKINPDVVREIVRQPYPNVSLSELIRNVGQQGLAKIKFEIGQGLLQGEGPAKIGRRIRDSLNISLNRAVKIARTEGLTAQSKANMIADQKAVDKGIDIKRIWDATLDGRTRPAHRQADGQREDGNGDFTVGGVKFLAPRVVSPRNTAGSQQTASQRINCRCTTISEIEDVPETTLIRKRKEKTKIGDLTYTDWKKGKNV